VSLLLPITVGESFIAVMFFSNVSPIIVAQISHLTTLFIVYVAQQFGFTCISTVYMYTYMYVRMHDICGNLLFGQCVVKIN